MACSCIKTIKFLTTVAYRKLPTQKQCFLVGSFLFIKKIQAVIIELYKEMKLKILKSGSLEQKKNCRIKLWAAPCLTSIYIDRANEVWKEYYICPFNDEQDIKSLKLNNSNSINFQIESLFYT